MTHAVSCALYDPRVDRANLQSGDELRCPHCRKWHPLIQKHREGTEATVRMLYFVCRGLPYFGGFIGAGSRHETRKVAKR